MDQRFDMLQQYKKTAKVFKALCDENRLMILEKLKNGEKCACDLLDELDIVQSTLSHHMKILVESGLVTSKKNGKWTNYSLSLEGAQHATHLLNSFFKESLSQKEPCLCK